MSALSPLPDAVRHALASSGSAAFVFAPATACVVSANSEGWRVLGRSADSSPLFFDGATPAVHVLRAIETRKSFAVDVVDVVFWTSQGMIVKSCRVEAIEGGTGESLLLVTCRDHAGVESRPAREDNLVSVLPSPRDDGETLREIARRIREGQTRVVSVAAEPSISEPEELEAVDAETLAAITETVTITEPAARSEPAGSQQDYVNMRHAAPLDLAKLAHELKSPISAISAAAEVMRDQRFGPIGDARYAGYASGIHDSAKHALAVIDRMLNVTPELADQRSMRFIKVDLNRLVETCVASMQPLAEHRTITLKTDLSSATPHVVADETSLRQILLNLLTNAIKFTPKGGTVDVATQLDRNTTVALVVHDSGPGMTPAQISDAVGAAAVTGPRLREGGGFGLGLPLVHALVEANGARLKIESAPGQGTEVILVFPKGRLIAI